jgi:hypothetical protein
MVSAAGIAEGYSSIAKRESLFSWSLIFCITCISTASYAAAKAVIELTRPIVE